MLMPARLWRSTATRTNGEQAAQRKRTLPRELYVLREADAIHGVFAFILGEDPTYRVIEQGAWLSDAPYGTIHAVASDGQIHGLLSQIVAYCEQTTKHLRIDTHHDNAIMQHVILKNGFTRCGVIHIASGAERIAFEKV